MKLIIFFLALIALTCAAPAEKKPVEDKKAVEKTTDDKKPAADEKKPVEKPVEEKKDEERKGLNWPLPDPENEGDLMLHGAHLMDRVEELHKGKVEKDEEKMILSVGREYLRRVHKYLEKVTDFKISPVLCRDSERMNSTRRWEIRLRPSNQRLFPFGGLSTDGQTEKQQTGEQQNDAAPSKEATQSKDQAKQNDPKVIDAAIPSNANATTHENVTEVPASNTTDLPVPAKGGKNFEDINDEYYKRMGDNFARLLMKRYRKEKMEKEEIDYLARWLNEESVHYGFMGIYCHDGENVKELTKRISTFIEEKP